MISKYGKLAQKEYKTRHDRVGKVICWELCKKLESDHTSKGYVHKSESAQQNATHKIIWDSELQTGPLIPVKRPDYNVNWGGGRKDPAE